VFCYLERSVLKRFVEKRDVSRVNFIKGITGEHSYCTGSLWLLLVVFLHMFACDILTVWTGLKHPPVYSGDIVDMAKLSRGS